MIGSDDPPPWGDRFEILSKLGEGGFATVYRALDTATRSTVALKVLHATMDPDVRDRMRREIDVLKTLDSPFIVSLFEADEHYGWYSMPLAEADLATRGPMLDRCERAEVVMSIARALADAHNARVIHRDVSPRNVLWFPNERQWKLADFGLVRRFPGHTTRVITDAPGAWTLLFAAPELEINPHLIDHRADIFSFGQVIGWLTSGRYPAPQSQNQNAPEPWHDLVRRMTSRPMSERPARIDIVVDEVRQVIDILRGENRTAWEAGFEQMPVSNPKPLLPAVDPSARLVLRYVFSNGPTADWRIKNAAHELGLTDAGVRVGIFKARYAGMLVTCEITDEGGAKYMGWEVSPEGADYLMATFTDDELFIKPESLGAPSDDIPF